MFKLYLTVGELVLIQRLLDTMPIRVSRDFHEEDLVDSILSKIESAKLAVNGPATHIGAGIEATSYNG